MFIISRFHPDPFKIPFINIKQNNMHNNDQDNESVTKSGERVAVITGSSKGIGRAIYNQQPLLYLSTHTRKKKRMVL